jgi:hypothetical protein
MGTKKIGLVGQCIYCGQIAERHDDHVPPDCLFPKPKPASFITVPCCQPCNKGFEKDDEHFKTSIALCIDAQDDPRFQQIIDSSVRALSQKDRGAKRALVLGDTQKVMARGSAGLYLPTLTFTVDVNRFKRFGQRLVKGLYYAETGKRLPDSCEIETLINDVPFDLDLMNDLLSQPAKVIDDTVFAYRCRIDAVEPLRSAWILAFYRRFYIAGRTNTESQL